MRQGFDPQGNDTIHDDDTTPDQGPCICDACSRVTGPWPQPSEPVLCPDCARIFNVDYCSPFTTTMDGDF